MNSFRSLSPPSLYSSKCFKSPAFACPFFLSLTLAQRRSDLYSFFGHIKDTEENAMQLQRAEKQRYREGKAEKMEDREKDRRER